MSDLSGKTQNELIQLIRDAEDELERRRQLRALETDSRRINKLFAEMTGRKPGDPFIKPTGGHNAYWTGDLVEFKGSIYRSKIDGNFLSPEEGPVYWENQTPTDEVLDFVKPTGAHDAIPLGGKRRYKGKIYESLIPNNTYTPEEYPPAWKELP